MGPPRLPDAPSELIRLALSDLRKVEKDERYVVDMDEWHWPPPRGRCHVCLAGAVMAGTLGVDPREYILPASFSLDSEKLRSLNTFRLGFIGHGLERLYGVGHLPEGVPDHVDVPDYKRDRARFYDAMLAMADMLEEHNL
jgi:hypothetical protein